MRTLLLPRSATLPTLLALGVLLSGCQAPRLARPEAPWFTTRQALTLLSANDGQVHLRLNPAHIASNVPLKLDRNFTRDGSQLFVQCTSANHVVVFDVGEGK